MCVTRVSIYSMTLGSYDVILGMDWLETHSAMLGYKEKKIMFIEDFGHNLVLLGTKRGVSLRFISTLQLNKIMCKGCELYAVVVINNKKYTIDVGQHPILSDFSNVFLEELPGLPPKWELEFTIELKPGAEPISRVLYHMKTLELQKLHIQLQDILDLGFIHPIISPWGGLVIFLKKKVHGDFALTIVNWIKQQ